MRKARKEGSVKEARVKGLESPRASVTHLRKSNNVILQTGLIHRLNALLHQGNVVKSDKSKALIGDLRKPDNFCIYDL